ncbi:pilus assembly protein [Herbaspirillum sp. GCM10030257]|uniref:pilus assembly protein n=1 Tax=Herbaspirillum sp. GCM10030257 TaxID=3273393 RepID=UPI00360B36E8
MTYRNPTATAKSVFQISALLAGTALLPTTAWTAATDLANVPLANATTTAIYPNIAYVFDDSGSMDDENMPDSDSTNKGNYCWKWHKYNTLAYNPAQVYRPPIKADGTRFPNAVFTSALKDGYFASTAKQFNGSSNNGYVDITSIGAVTTTKATITLPDLGSSKYYASGLKVTLLDGTQVELLDSAEVPGNAGTSNEDTLGVAIRDSINARTATTGFSASYSSSGNRLTISAPEGQVGLTSTPNLALVKRSGNNRSATVNAFVNTTSPGFFYATHKTDVNSKACDDDNDYDVVMNKSNIAAPNTTAGSADALTNYANWYSYYRKRAFLAKAGIGEAFSELDQDKYRIGLFFINSIESGVGSTNHDLIIDTFSSTHRSNWFDRLYSARMDGYTPLRGALSRMGRMYAGQISGWDPVQYSCQRNYTILSTDGYWNNDTETSSYGPKKMDGSTNVGDQDGVAGVTRPELDSSKAQNTLADVAYYYYHTDLRPGTCASPDVCKDNVSPTGTDPKVDDIAQHQHMTTFTVGLGVDGALTYQDGYKTSTSGDYFNIKQGTKNWPNPISNTTTARIDDLWHAAVNGRGTYFSAKDPDSLADGLGSALKSIDSKTGSGAAAATSNLQPTTGDNAIYIATYRTLKWDGQISAYTVDLTTGAISSTPTWQGASLLRSKIAASGDSDSRTIYTANGTSRTLFKAGTGGLTAAQEAYFDTSKLTQYSDWSTSQKTTATASSLINYLRGQDRFEDQERDAKTYGDYSRLYRDREEILGDIIHAQPVYVKVPPHNFVDDGYADFKAQHLDRAATLYVAANDGMLHAFDATTGTERWAYIPPIILPELWRLADSEYGTNHRFYLDGPLTVTDAKIGTSWKTILIGALGKGGRGYYALDVTDPADPKPMWNFSAADKDNVGYSYGIPYVTKLADGSWVAIVTSGYNNIPEGSNYPNADGKGYVYVLNLANGSVIKTIPTNEGSVDNPGGLAKVNVKVREFSVDNTAVAAYGGDLLGNMWRFDLNAGTAHKLAAMGTEKPIMASPEIADVDGKNVVYFGSGRYLGTTDLSSTTVQSIYAVRDDGSTTITGTSQLIQQQVSGNGVSRSGSKDAVDWTTDFGWYIDLPDSGERVTVDPQLYFGTLVMATTVPEASACQPGGYSWLYQLDYRTGGYVGSTTTVASKFTSPIVGVTVSKLPGGKPVTYPITADGQKPVPIDMRIAPAGSAGGAKRVLWRELFD